MSTPEPAVADSTVRIGLLMEAVESQRALVGHALEQLQAAHRRPRCGGAR